MQVDMAEQPLDRTADAGHVGPPPRPDRQPVLRTAGDRPPQPQRHAAVPAFEPLQPTVMAVPPEQLVAAIPAESDRGKRAHGSRVEIGQQHRRIRYPIVVLPRRSAEHTSELQSLLRISSALLCFNKHTVST